MTPWGLVVSHTGCRHVASLVAVWRLSQLSDVAPSPAVVVSVPKAASQTAETSKGSLQASGCVAGPMGELGQICFLHARDFLLCWGDIYSI